jgi:hypothetical protein
MEKLRASGAAAAGGSFLELVPPFPKVRRWVQAPRESWQEKGFVPQLLVLWSIEQNELIPLHEWLADLAQRFGPSGLEIVSVASPNDDAAIDAYLKEHRFPGSVAVDFREGVGVGETNKAFFTPRFNLPRILLLDIDQKVVWEGDPGFKIGEKWGSGLDSFVEAPLQELIAKRKLDQLRAWMAAWQERGAAELHAGELEKALPRMLEARELDGRVVPLAYDVQRKLEALEAALADLVKSGAELEKAGRAPALRVLVEWWRLTTAKELDKTAQIKLKPFLEGPQGTNWDRALKMAESYAPKVAKDPAAAGELADKLAGLKGAFPSDLAERVRSAGKDRDELAKVLASAPRLPREWLAQQHFRW